MIELMQLPLASTCLAHPSSLFLTGPHSFLTAVSHSFLPYILVSLISPPLHTHTYYMYTQTDVAAASAILRQFERVPEGYNYFRLHPKGRGMLVARPGGLGAFTFVEEYLGEVHTGG